MNAKSPSSFPDIAFEQPLFQSDRIAEGVERMRAQITSTTQLESAYKIVQPQVDALGLELSEEDAQQLLELYNVAVADGRYITDLVSDPKGVAKKLKVRISNDAADALKQAGSIEALRTEVQGYWVQVVIVAVVIVIVFGPHAQEPRVVDSSGIVKF